MAIYILKKKFTLHGVMILLIPVNANICFQKFKFTEIFFPLLEKEDKNINLEYTTAESIWSFTKRD